MTNNAEEIRIATYAQHTKFAGYVCRDEYKIADASDDLVFHSGTPEELVTMANNMIQWGERDKNAYMMTTGKKILQELNMQGYYEYPEGGEER